MDLSWLIAALSQAPGLSGDLLGFLDTKIPPEFAADWATVRAQILAAADPVAANQVIAESVTGALQSIIAGHGPIGDDQANIG